MAALSASPFPTREVYVTLAGRSAPKKDERRHCILFLWFALYWIYLCFYH